MRIAIGGAHRTGKTTIGVEVARIYGYKFEKTEVSKAPVWKEFVDKSSAYMTFAERAVLQAKLMSYLRDKFFSFYNRRNSWVADRTPFDVLAYLMANIDHTCSDLFYDVFTELQDTAFTIAAKYIDTIVIIQPGIEIPADDTDPYDKNGKVYNSSIYKETLNAIIQSKTLELFPTEQVIIVPRNVLSVSDRLAYIRHWLNMMERPLEV